MINRFKCLTCDGKLETFHTLEKFPVYMGIGKVEELPHFENMNWANCMNCGCVQLKELIDPNILYKTPHNPTLGNTWNEHNIKLAEYITERDIEDVLDVGGANLKIANIVTQSDTIKSYTVVDISANCYDQNSNPKIKTIKDFVENIKIYNKFDCVVLSHTFEHFYEPKNVLNVIKNLLNENGLVIISVPNIENQLKDGFLNALNFEHTYYINDYYIDLICGNCGFELVDKKEFSKYNSFYIYKKSKNTLTNIILSKKEHAKEIYQNHILQIKKDVENINNFIKNKEIYCFGAHVFTQMLINFGLDVKKIKSILDNDPNKIGNYLYGTTLKINSPSVIKDDDHPIILLRVAQYKDEIIEGLYKHNSNIILL